MADIRKNMTITQTDKEGELDSSMTFTVMFNPDNFTIKEDIIWCDQQSISQSSSDPKYVNLRPRTFSIEFIIDGTGVFSEGKRVSVREKVIMFRRVTSVIKGEIHRPPYLIVQYGSFLMSCIMNSSEITYSMFDIDGEPLRAKISARFTERISENLRQKELKLSSPDLTHRVYVKEGDMLPSLTYNIYKNQMYYIQVARINKLKNLRSIMAGTNLIFPPIAKK